MEAFYIVAARRGDGKLPALEKASSTHLNDAIILFDLEDAHEIAEELNEQHGGSGLFVAFRCEGQVIEEVEW